MYCPRIVSMSKDLRFRLKMKFLYLPLWQFDLELDLPHYCEKFHDAFQQRRDSPYWLTIVSFTIIMYVSRVFFFLMFVYMLLLLLFSTCRFFWILFWFPCLFSTCSWMMNSYCSFFFFVFLQYECMQNLSCVCVIEYLSLL